MLDNKKGKVAGAIMAAAAFASGTAQADIVDFQEMVKEYEYDTSDGAWNYITHAATASGEEEKVAEYPTSTVFAEMGTTASIHYSSPRDLGGTFPQTYTPNSADHNMEVDTLSSPSGSGGMRISDIEYYQYGEDDQELGAGAKAALSYLKALVETAVGLPIPNPLALAKDETGVDVVEDNSQSAEFDFNDDPQSMGLNWLVYLRSDVEVGWYRLTTTSQVDAGFIIGSQTTHASEESIGLGLGCDLYIHR